MDSEYFKQILIAKQFHNELKLLFNSKTHLQNIIITEHDRINDVINCRVGNNGIQNNHNFFLYSKVMELLYEFIKSKKHNLYKICKEIFPLIEIICNDESEFTVIKPTEITERTDIRLLNNAKIYKETMDLMQSKYAATEINFYYSDNSIEKFKFKIIDYSNQLIQNNDFFIKTYFHNVRVYLAILICQAYYLIKSIKEKCE